MVQQIDIVDEKYLNTLHRRVADAAWDVVLADPGEAKEHLNILVKKIREVRKYLMQEVQVERKRGGPPAAPKTGGNDLSETARRAKKTFLFALGGDE